MPNDYFPGQAAGCKPMSYNHEQNAKDDEARKPYLAILQLETPGYDYEERTEPKTGRIANIRNRPCDLQLPQSPNPISDDGDSLVDLQSKRIDRANENYAMAA